MTIFVPLALFGFPFVTVVLFSLFPARLAAAIAFIAGYLFLPNVGYSVPGLPDIDKNMVTSGSVFLATIAFAPERITRVRWSWIDLPILGLCCCSVLSSLANGLGLYDGVSASFNNVVLWGLPYLVGRIYFGDLSGQRLLAVAIVVGGLVYVPLCLYEIRMSPQISNMVYGFVRWGGMRLGGWRPVVFLDSGLQLGMWMVASAFVSYFMWRSGALPRILNAPPKLYVPVLLVTTLLCRSLGAFAIFLITAAALTLSYRVRRFWPISVVFLLCPLYLLLRGPDLWSGEQLVNVARVISEDRAASLQFRFVNEDMLSERARERPIFGWGGWGRNRIHNDRGEDISVTDGLWIIYFGVNGAVGLTSLYGVFLVPGFVLLSRLGPLRWTPQFAPAVCLALMPCMFAIDGLLNAMPNPIYTFAAGAVAAMAAEWRVPPTYGQRFAAAPRHTVRHMPRSNDPTTI